MNENKTLQNSPGFGSDPFLGGFSCVLPHYPVGPMTCD